MIRKTCSADRTMAEYEAEVAASAPVDAMVSAVLRLPVSSDPGDGDGYDTLLDALSPAPKGRTRR